MLGLFGDDRTIEVILTPKKRFQFVRPTSTKPKRPPTTTVIHQPSHKTEPIEDTFVPLEGEDLPLTLHHTSRRSSTYVPLPPVVHQEYIPQQLPFHPQQQIAASAHHDPGDRAPIYDLLPPAVHQKYLTQKFSDHPQRQIAGPRKSGHHHRSYPFITSSSSDNSTLASERAISRIPKRVFRTHSSSPGGSLHRRDGEGKYHYYSPSYYSSSSRSRTSGGGDEWEDEWDRRTLKSEWSDGGDEWEDERPRRIKGNSGGGGRREGPRNSFWR